MRENIKGLINFDALQLTAGKFIGVINDKSLERKVLSP
jgi:hypothetical protein